MRSRQSRRRAPSRITSPINRCRVGPPFRRAIVIVMDSVGIGELPDAAEYGDQGSDTLGHIADRIALHIPTLRALGLGRVAAIGADAGRALVAGEPTTSDGRHA